MVQCSLVNICLLRAMAEFVWRHVGGKHLTFVRGWMGDMWEQINIFQFFNSISVKSHPPIGHYTYRRPIYTHVERKSHSVNMKDSLPT